jgi:hypothetical protein
MASPSTTTPAPKGIPNCVGTFAQIVQRDYGEYQLGIHDGGAGPFRTRDFAAAVAAKEARHLPQWGRQ